MYNMLKKLSLAASMLLCTVLMMAQGVTGGVKGTVISRGDRSPVGGAKLTLLSGAETVAQAQTAPEGTFLIENLADGVYTLVIESDEFLQSTVNVTVNDGYVKNMFNLSLTPARVVADTPDATIAEFDLDDSGYSDNPTLLFQSNDVFTNQVGYNFSSVRFKLRGYNSETQDVYLAGVKMNDAITGYSPFSLWSGLNEATRAKDDVIGLETSKYGLGGYNGLTNIAGNASSMRKGLRGSVLTNSSLYRLRLMLSYGSGVKDNGWSYAFNVSARLGDNDWIKGVYYQSFAYYFALEKQFSDAHRLGFFMLSTPGQRGVQNASTQEVYDLMGDNMYNSNWGYQNGKMRNARVRKTNEPVAVLKYDFTPSYKFNASATVLYRFGKNGYTALDWYDAADPRPDYYRNLPSYFYSDNEDLERTAFRKAAWAREAWESNYTAVTHVNWDRLYTVNRLDLDSQGSARSKYVQEERHVDQQDLNLAISAQWTPAKWIKINGGINGKINDTENYKKLADLLGGDYYLDIDSFAERDYASSPAKTQNDLDYYLKTGSARTLVKGDKYGYDYYAHIRHANGWLNGSFTSGSFSGNIGGQIGYESFWREGLLRKGLFPGLDENGREYFGESGEKLTTYDSFGRVITSKGNSDKAEFVTWSTKMGLEYVIGNKMRVYAHAGAFADAPTFNQAFLSPRTRNQMMEGLTTVKTYTADLNYQFSSNGYNLRVTGYYTRILDQSDLMSFYDDSQNSFTNFAMTGIDQLHKGVELGFKLPTPVSNLSLQGALSWGEYTYTSNPYMTQTVDNSSEVTIDHQKIPYWMSHPVFKRDSQGAVTTEVDHFQKHYVPSTPQLAATLGLAYNINYWFIDTDVDYFAKSYLDMNPLYRTDMASAGADHIVTPVEIEYMASQEMFDPAFVWNCSVGKSWFIHGNQLGFSLQVKNMLNNRSVRTGGYEQTRIIDNTKLGERYYRFDSKYFYMYGANYMLNIYFRF